MYTREWLMTIAASEGLDKIKRFLEERELRHEIEGDAIFVPYEINGMVFEPKVEVHGKWIVVSSIIVEAFDLPRADAPYLAGVYRRMLRAMHDLPEINFNLDASGSIFTSVDMRLEITDYNNFFSEFFAIPYGIKYFIEKIAPSVDPPIVVKGLPEQE